MSIFYQSSFQRLLRDVRLNLLSLVIVNSLSFTFQKSKRMEEQDFQTLVGHFGVQINKKRRKDILKNAVCQICSDAANEYKHFGGSNICFSCKAFFRRAVRSQREKKCKQFGDCKINFVNRKSCHYCRFQKCLKAGMDPKWVMSKRGTDLIKINPPGYTIPRCG